MLGSLGWQELLIILVIIALLFGASRVGDMGKALGRGVKEFRAEATAKDEPKPAAPATPAAPAASTAPAPRRFRNVIVRTSFPTVHRRFT